MKTLVTGATGFVGSKLINTLRQQGRSIKCLVRKDSDAARLGTMGVEAICGDLNDSTSLNEATKGIGTVFHLGGEVYSRQCWKYFDANVVGTEKLVKACLSNQIEKFIFMSSLAACGPATNGNENLTEKTKENPLVPYGKSKLEAERKIYLLSGERQLLPFVIVRGPTLYGPGQGKLINQLILNIISGRLPFIGNSTEKPMRSLCFIDNLIEGLQLVEKNGKFIGEKYIVADETPYSQTEIQNTILELAERRETNRKKIASFIAKGAYTVEKISNLLGLTFIELYSIFSLLFNFSCDISKAKRELRYMPKYNLYTGMKQTIQWMRETGVLGGNQK